MDSSLKTVEDAEIILAVNCAQPTTKKKNTKSNE